MKDPSAAIRKRAASFPDAEEGMSCSQTSFKINKKAFLYIGMQGGRHKAMFKLKDSIPDAKKASKADPDNFQVGNTAWVTARFTAENPLPMKLWEKWLAESYSLSGGLGGIKTPKKKVAKMARKKSAKKTRAIKKKK